MRFGGADMIVNGAALQACAALSRTAPTTIRRTLARISMACAGRATLIYRKPGFVKSATGMNAVVGGGSDTLA
jgi:hypothetical protein